MGPRASSTLEVAVKAQGPGVAIASASEQTARRSTNVTVRERLALCPTAHSGGCTQHARGWRPGRRPPARGRCPGGRRSACRP
eukprot:9796455-Alexandrium_andersonii.AAC.1